MSPFFFFVQLLNAVQYGLILYLVASGLTLLLGIMGVINLAHGAFYMVGAYMAFAVVQHLASFWLALPLGNRAGPRARCAAGTLSALAARRCRSPVAGAAQLRADPASSMRASASSSATIRTASTCRSALNFSIPLSDTFAYPAYRLFVCAIGIAFVGRRQSGDGANPHRHDAARQRREPPRWRARSASTPSACISASPRSGIACAVLAGVIAAPIASVYPGMGDQVLILVVRGDCARRHRLASRRARGRDAARIGRRIRQAILSELSRRSWSMRR